MPPNSDNNNVLRKSSWGFKYPKHRDVANKNGYLWLKDKQQDDGAEGLWRIHDSLYDLNEFISQHPGGSTWLELTKGTDITEAFEVHHIFETPEELLPNFFVRKAKTPRAIPYTFKEDGFYKTLKRNARKVIKNLPENTVKKTNIIIDACLVLAFVSSIIACRIQNVWIDILSAYFLTCTVIMGHNYFHQKDNFRMYYFDLSGMGSKDWRISHALSHHLLTNTIQDLEISLFEPMLEYLPHQNKTAASIIKSWLFSIVLYILLYPKTLIVRLMAVQFKNFNWEILIPFSLPVAMCIFGGESIITALWVWIKILLIASFIFGFIGLNAAHHHPDIFHDGDALREDKDWGLAQLESVMDRYEVATNHFLVASTFGNHALHHMFPTLDHGHLVALYPVLIETCKQFDISFRFASIFEMLKGNLRQLARTEPNKKPINLNDLKYNVKI